MTFENYFNFTKNNEHRRVLRPLISFDIFGDFFCGYSV